MVLMPPDKRQLTFIFDRMSGASVEVQQILPFAYPENEDHYFLTLRLQTIWLV